MREEVSHSWSYFGVSIEAFLGRKEREGGRERERERERGRGREGGRGPCGCILNKAANP